MNPQAFRTAIVLSLLIGAGTVITSCKKDKKEESIDTIDYLDNSAMENAFAQMLSDVDEAVETSEGLKKTSSGCPTITVDSSQGWPRSLTIDFGTSCTAPNGVVRTGKIVAWFTGRYKAQGTVITIRPYNYSVNGNAVQGVKRVTNSGLNQAGNLTWNVQVDSGLVTFTDGTTRTWTSTRTREMLAGQSTWTPMDDEYSVTGGGSGITRSGKNYTVTITNPVEWGYTCRWPRQGTIQITVDDAAGTIDFGNGNCDNAATVTTPRGTRTIQMR
jgi:hypothetical protein